MSFFNSKISNIKTIRTSPNTQLSTGNWQYLSGSRIAYTPSNNAQNIVYQFSFGWHRATNDDNLTHIKLVSGSNESEINSSPSDVFGANFNLGATNAYSRGSVTLKRMIPAWQGEKVIQTSFRWYNSGWVAEMHDLDFWHGGAVSNPINCHLLVYSVE